MVLAAKHRVADKAGRVRCRVHLLLVVAPEALLAVPLVLGAVLQPLHGPRGKHGEVLELAGDILLMQDANLAVSRLHSTDGLPQNDHQLSTWEYLCKILRTAPG